MITLLIIEMQPSVLEHADYLAAGINATSKFSTGGKEQKCSWEEAMTAECTEMPSLMSGHHSS